MNQSHHSGNIITEYLVVLVFMVAAVWYGLMGSPLEADGGADSDSTDLTVISVLNDQQHEFARDIYKP